MNQAVSLVIHPMSFAYF